MSALEGELGNLLETIEECLEQKEYARLLNLLCCYCQKGYNQNAK